MFKWQNGFTYFSEGNAKHERTPGWKGSQPGRNDQLRHAHSQGFTVTTEACTDYYNNGKKISEEIQGQIFDALAELEKIQGKKFGDTEDPLLVSVRSGARASMPGMMDTILNLGLNDVAVEALLKRQAIQDSHMILTDVLSRCTLT